MPMPSLNGYSEKSLLQREEVARLIAAELNIIQDLNMTMTKIILFLRAAIGCEAIAVRVQNKEDYPYFVWDGFPQNFIDKESSLTVRGEDCRPVWSTETRRYVLECMCGNIISGLFDPSMSFFTPNGSFWTNSTTDLLAVTTEAQRQTSTRNYCNHCGYESVALVPIKAGGKVFGLVQLNDSRRDIFSEEKILYVEMIAQNIGLALLAFKIKPGEERLTRTIVRSDADGIINEVADAATQQIQSLPADIIDRHITVTKIYRPCGMISGDYMDYSWDLTGTIIRGFLIDVCGHGVPTAFLTASVQVLFQEALFKGEKWADTLRNINIHALRYCEERSFISAVCFEFDLQNKIMRCILAGDCGFFVSTANQAGRMLRSGSLIGISEDFEFEEIVMPALAGDEFYFATDGLYGMLDGSRPPVEQLAAMFRQPGPALKNETLNDDASGICVRIR